jgi:hypothetical protein
MYPIISAGGAKRNTVVIVVRKNCRIASTVPAVFRFVNPVLKRISGGFPMVRLGSVLIANEFA